MIRITIEGPEHAGKSTLVAFLAQKLADAGVDVKHQQFSDIEKKMERPEERLVERLEGEEVLMMVMQSSR